MLPTSYTSFSRLPSSLNNLLRTNLNEEKSEGPSVSVGPSPIAAPATHEQALLVPQSNVNSHHSCIEPPICLAEESTLEFAEARLTHHVRPSSGPKAQPINKPKDMPRGHPQQHADSAYLRTSSEMNTSNERRQGTKLHVPGKCVEAFIETNSLFNATSSS